MSRFLRMISKITRWDGSESVNRKDGLFTGDMLADLRTTNNKLSVWQVDGDEDVEKAIVALALSRDTVQKMCYMFLDEDELESIGISIIKDSNIPSYGIDSSVLSNHGDMVNIDYWRLGFLTEYILKIAQNTSCKTFSKPEVTKLLNKYKNIISLDGMKDTLKKDLKW